MRFAFLIMGDFDSNIDKAAIHDGSAQIIGVSDMQQAIEEARRLEKEGIGCIELCGAFGEENECSQNHRGDREQDSYRPYSPSP